MTGIHPPERLLTIGITGGIGSGKTSVARIFGQLGSAVVEADSLARELSETRPGIRSGIRRHFGNDAVRPDGTLNRPRLAELIFSDPRKQATLNALVHPAVIRELRHRIRQIQRRGTHPLVAVEAALIYEAHTEAMFDYIIVVDAPLKERIRRIMERDPLSREEVLRRMNAQMPVREKLSRADFVIDNSGTSEQLYSNCRFLYRLLNRLARPHSREHAWK